MAKQLFHNSPGVIVDDRVFWLDHGLVAHLALVIDHSDPGQLIALHHNKDATTHTGFSKNRSISSLLLSEEFQD